MKPSLCHFVILLALFATSTLGQNSVHTEPVYSVPDINGCATLLVQPEFSGSAAQKKDGNTLVVKIVVDARGDVVSAKCSLTCPRSAAGPAEAAATASKFRPLIVNGQAVR
jgi:hypothetical protein